MQKINPLYDTLLTMADRDFYQIETEFFMMLQRIPDHRKPDAVVAFLTISNWKGTSLRSGVWTFYESAQQRDLEITSTYLTNAGQIDLAEVFSRGIHDYQNPVYAENFDYPSEWMDEEDEIDHWISTHEHWLDTWMRNLLLYNRETVIALFS